MIYIDIDDVISDTTITFPFLLERHFGRSVPFEAITSFDLRESFSLDADELDRFMHIAHSPEVITGYEPRAGALESLNSLISTGYDIAIVTGRPLSAKKLTEEWLEKHGIKFHHLLFVDKYSRVLPNTRFAFAVSLEELSGMQFCFAVEDSCEMAEFLSWNMSIPVALMDRPWNQHFQGVSDAPSSLVRRCRDWNDVMETFREVKYNLIEDKSNRTHGQG